MLDDAAYLLGVTAIIAVALWLIAVRLDRRR